MSLELNIELTDNDGNLPPLQKIGFLGRTQELSQIERAFVQEGVRRLTISGVGGQGKTYLAIYAGQCLYQKGVFEKICFMDYSAFVGVDAVGLAMRTLMEVLDKPDEKAAHDALHDIPTLWILDNVERLPAAQLQELLDAAKKWSEIGACRVLLTSQAEHFEHPAYQKSLFYQSLPLSGLGEEEVLTCYRHWLAQPTPIVSPQREELLTLFEQVAFNPLSIRILAIALKRHNPAELGKRLQGLLVQTTDNPLGATLDVYLESWEEDIHINVLLVWLAKLFGFKLQEKLRLDTATLELLLCLGVFQGGAFEPEILAITKIPKKQWRLLRSALENAGLIQAEFLQDFVAPYLKFHPTLAPILWRRLPPLVQNQIQATYRWRYVELISYLFFEEGKNTLLIHALAKRDLPNILHTIYTAIEAKERWVPKVANYVDLFINTFGLKRESAAINQLLEKNN